jgi:ATP-dependent helicase/nuclease subunit A
MTVHGAKGLEASVVFLVDTTTAPADTQHLRLIHLPGGVSVWGGRKADDPLAVAAARKTMMDDIEHEYRRLLYVAMTRAADRLIVGGCMPGNRNKLRELSWYDLIGKGLDRSGLALQEIETPEGKVKRYSRSEDAAASTDTAAAPGAPTPIELPAWLRSLASPEITVENMLRPSDPAENEGHGVRTGESVALRARALQRGALVHRLLQSLPDIAAASRRAAALKYLARNADGWTEIDRETLAANVLALIEDVRFASVFADGSRAEVSIVGRLDRQTGPRTLVSGQIDRLVVTPSEILIVDYKTNHAPPATATDAPRAYVRQLALYRALLAKLYPGRAVRAALLWTETPELMEISAPALDAALAVHHLGVTELDPATSRS